MALGETHELAWDGVTLRVPAAWNLAGYVMEKGVTRLELEDDVARRAVFQWAWPKSPDVERVRARLAAQEKRFEKEVTEREELADLPTGWLGTRYTMTDGRTCLALTCVRAKEGWCGCLLTWFAKPDRERPAEVLRLLTESCQLQHGDTRRWAVYDMVVDVPARYKLSMTHFEAGRKCMVFRWRLRRLAVWQVSLAQLVVKRGQPGPWCAQQVMLSKLFRGARWSADGDRLVGTPKHVLGLPHGDNLGRWCFHYAGGWRHDPTADRLHFRVAHVRRAAEAGDWLSAGQ